MNRIRLAIIASVLFISPLAALAQTQQGQLPDADKTPGVTLTHVPDEKAATCLTDLMERYHNACAHGRTAEAKSLAAMCLDCDPTCFAK